ncbi:MAG TPA: alpha/beta fold hydrolase [Candidatus Lumbricidophila sp.]|nr:alpha/beta fold hydrolase [Candidatus Lumbricidophila sp.]
MASRQTRGRALRVAAVMASGIVAGSAAAAAVVTLRFARTVVTPPTSRKDDIRVLGVDSANDTITLRRSDESAMRGIYGFWFNGGSGYARLGDVINSDDRIVVRAVEQVLFGRLDRATKGRMTGWYYLGPWDLTLPFEKLSIDTTLGPAPAWLVPSERTSHDWVIQVHGWGSARPEGLRAAPVARRDGWNSLHISYRNDGTAPESPDNRLGLGGTEWRDLAAAVDYVTECGAKRIVLMGWSMGGATVLQLLLRSPKHHERVVGVVLDSPAIDWVDILQFQGTLKGLPRVGGTVIARFLGHHRTSRLVGLATPIDFAALDAVTHAPAFNVPMLVMHSADDGFVPSDGSFRLAQARPDLVQFEGFTGARHAKLWNYDPERWERVLSDWLAARAD